jgi:tRNA U55 pseudouridine synthase TruB
VTVYNSQLFPLSGDVASICGAGIHPAVPDLWNPAELPSFKLEVECGGGFYVRSLIDDLGKDCDSYAHMTALLRYCSDTAVRFSEN